MKGCPVMRYLAMLIVSTIAFYTFLYGLEIKLQKNTPGFLAVSVLAATVIGLPLYLLFFR